LYLAILKEYNKIKLAKKLDNWYWLSWPPLEKLLTPLVETLAGFLDPNKTLKTGVEREFVTCMDRQLLIERQKSYMYNVYTYMYT